MSKKLKDLIDEEQTLSKDGNVESLSNTSINEEFANALAEMLNSLKNGYSFDVEEFDALVEKSVILKTDPNLIESVKEIRLNIVDLKKKVDHNAAVNEDQTKDLIQIREGLLNARVASAERAAALQDAIKEVTWLAEKSISNDAENNSEIHNLKVFDKEVASTLSSLSIVSDSHEKTIKKLETKINYLLTATVVSLLTAVAALFI